MFLHDYVMKGLLDSIGKMPDYWVINSSLNWFERGTLVQADLEQINAKIDEKNTPVEIPVEEIENIEE